MTLDPKEVWYDVEWSHPESEDWRSNGFSTNQLKHAQEHVDSIRYRSPYDFRIIKRTVIREVVQ